MQDLINKMNGALEILSLDAKCVYAKQNRHLAFFDIRPGNSCRVRKLESFAKEISIILRSKTEPITTLIPQEGIVRFRFAMDNSQILKFDDLYKSSLPETGIVPVLLGETDNGLPLWLDLALNPHMLIAGSSGSGKTTLLHVLIANLLKRDDVDVLLVDPKFGVEFSKYKEAEVAKDYDEAMIFLENLHFIMENRYKMMAKLGISSIEQNTSIFTKKVLIIDEVADLMVIDKKNNNKFETLLCKIAQKARACGIYIILATQRPSVDVITGLIKANFPARLACKVSTSTDSRVILDRTGAESLLGRGDAIINSFQHSFVRFQVAYLS